MARESFRHEVTCIGDMEWLGRAEITVAYGDVVTVEERSPHGRHETFDTFEVSEPQILSMRPWAEFVDADCYGDEEGFYLSDEELGAAILHNEGMYDEAECVHSVEFTGSGALRIEVR